MTTKEKAKTKKILKALERDYSDVIKKLSKT